MSKKWFVVLLIAAIIGLIIAVSLKAGPALMAQFSTSKNKSTSTISPSPISSREEVPPANNTTRSNPVAQAIPMQTTRTDEPISEMLEASSEDSAHGPVNYSTFENPQFGVQVLYPSNWRTIEGGDNNNGVIDVVSFVSPFEDRFDTYKERLRISIDSLPQGKMTLQDYSGEVISRNNETLRDFQLVDNDTDSTILSGNPAYRFIHTRSLDDGKIIKQMEIGTKITNKIYYLSYSAEEGRYNYFLPVIQPMINSFNVER